MGHATSYLKNIFRFNYLSIRIQKKQKQKKNKKKTRQLSRADISDFKLE